MSADPITIAAVGYGYWGPNVVRNLVERPEFEFAALCELSEERAADFRRRFPGIPVEPDYDTLLADPDIEAVSIATRPHTHYALVKKALEAGKHVLVEKPLATTSADAEELVLLAEERGLTLMPGHTFLYSPPVVKIRELIEEGTLGESYFVTSSRMNLGQYQPDGVVCDLAPHDFSILLYWLDQPLVQVAATGSSAFQADVPETAFLNLRFAGGAAANIQLSWLAPRKVRQMVIVGSKRMIQYDDTAVDEPVRIYDRGLDFELGQPENFGEYKCTYRSGDLIIPKIEPKEPLAAELQDFANAVRTGDSPRSHARLGLRIVRALEAATASLRDHGAPVIVDDWDAATPASVGAGTPASTTARSALAGRPFSRWETRQDRAVL